MAPAPQGKLSVQCETLQQIILIWECKSDVKKFFSHSSGELIKFCFNIPMSINVVPGSTKHKNNVDQGLFH